MNKEDFLKDLSEVEKAHLLFLFLKNTSDETILEFITLQCMRICEKQKKTEINHSTNITRLNSKAVLNFKLEKTLF